MLRKTKCILSWLLTVCMLIIPCGISRADQLSKLPAPTGLKWSEEVPGNIEWIPVDGVEGEYYFTVYRNGEKYTSIRLYNSFSGKFGLSQEIFNSGRYTFSIRSSGDNLNNEDSEDVFCEDEFIYNRPNVSLGRVSNLKWSEDKIGVATWEPVPNADYYEAKVYISEDGGISRLHVAYATNDTSADFSDYIDVSAVCYFTVRAFSNNIEKIAHGPYQRKVNYLIQAPL